MMSDEWWLPGSPGAQVGGAAYIKQHRSLADRLVNGNKFVKDFDFPIELVCDCMDNHVSDRFDSWPERLYIIQDGVIIYQGGLGPFDYNLPEVKQWLAERYGMRGESLVIEYGK